MEGKWISVNDRLPEFGQDILVFQKNTQKALMSTYDGERGFKVQKYHTEGDRTLVNHWAHVTHWMPLPKQPGEI